VSGLRALAQATQIHLTVVGPEAPLAAGIVDAFTDAGLSIVGPSREAAKLETSKTFAKMLMSQLGIPTADFQCFDDYSAALRFVSASKQSLVIKADGLAGGKGSIVCTDAYEAKHALHRIMIEREFGEAGQRVVIEDRLYGREVSVLAFCDGAQVITMPCARDYKRALENDRGPNTGGMGAIAPVRDVAPAPMEEINRTIIEPVVQSMAARGLEYRGVLYAGLILTDTGPKVLEFNCRFGDPEAEAILPLLATDLTAILSACAEGRLDSMPIRWHQQECATVVLAAPGYPGAFPTGLPILGLDDVSTMENVFLFHGATELYEGAVVTNGGRVLAVTGLGSDLSAALDRAYAAIAHLHFDGMQFRKDIGQDAL
jgi:phosphoribosylamine--glycine ligase